MRNVEMSSDFFGQMYIPIHGRPEAAKSLDYRELIRDESRYTRILRFSYAVKPGDLW